MALRSAVASAAVSRKAGRRRHRLGAFSLDRGRGVGSSSALARIGVCLRCYGANSAKFVANCADLIRPGAVALVHRVPDAPSTECPRLMALRVVVASAVVSRKVGRGRHRLGAFSLRAYRPCSRAPAARPRQRDHLRRRAALHRADAARPGVRGGVRPLEDRAPGSSSAPTAPARCSAGSRAGSQPRGSARSAPSSAGSLLLVRRELRVRARPTARSRSAPRGSSRASRARRPGQERSPGSPSRRRASVAER